MANAKTNISKTKMNKRPPTKMVRMRTGDIEELKRRARLVQKKLPDFMSEFIKAQRKMKGGNR